MDTRRVGRYRQNGLYRGEKSGEKRKKQEKTYEIDVNRTRYR